MIVTTLSCNLSGDIYSLDHTGNYNKNISLRSTEYANIFNSCPVVDASRLILYAATVPSNGYAQMFYNCTLLQAAPELRATTLNNYCYADMFRGCTSLQIPPKLPVTTLAEGCYSRMFYSSGLTVLPVLPATELADNCYKSMFHACNNIKLSTTQTSTYVNEYRIPTSGTITVRGSNDVTDMFAYTGGSFKGTPTVETTYYTSNEII